MNTNTKLININRALAGTAVISQQIIRNDGTIAALTIEQYEFEGFDTRFMFLVNGCTNYIGYPTSRKAINAAAKTTC